MRRRFPWAMPGLLACLPAHATGSEMAGLALAVPLLLALAVIALGAFTWIAHRLLPTGWPKRKRWMVAAVIAPLALVALVVAMTGLNLLKMLFARAAI